MKWIILLVVLAAGAGVWFHFAHQKEAQKIEDQARRDAAFAEMKLVKARIDVLNTWIDACKNHSAPAKLDGAYDGFSYDKQSDYVSQEQEQEQRYKDLQARLGTAVGN
jgi:hypothetical protein